MVKKLLKYCFLLLGALFYTSFANGQKPGVRIGYEVHGKDTIYVDRINELHVFNRPQSWKKSREWRKFYRTVYNFAKVYPYALKAKAIMREADSTLANSNFTRGQREKYIKDYEKKLFREFEKPLRSLSINQGKMLLKLIDREAGISSYYAIKNYKGGAAAGFWQGIAKLFGSDLKKKYDMFGEDRILEELIQMYQKGTFWYLYYSMFRE